VKLVATIALAAGVVLATWTLAFAHAEPARAKPGDGAVLNTPPTQVEITMSQEMVREAGQNDIDVFDAAGKEVTAVAAVIDNGDRRKLSVPLPSNLPPGAYTVKWKTRSADDGDAASGTLSFIYDPARSPSPGKEDLRPDVLGQSTPAASPAGKAPALDSADGGGTSWVLLVAVAVAALVVGGGGAFILIQKRP
jgi:methionine-rich copper-binding protein CopC